MTQCSTCLLQIPIAQSASSEIRVSLSADAVIAAVGRIREISPQADPVTRTFRVRVGLDNPPAAMRLGSTVNGAVDLSSSVVVAVPASALTSAQAGLRFGSSTSQVDGVAATHGRPALRTGPGRDLARAGAGRRRRHGGDPGASPRTAGQSAPAAGAGARRCVARTRDIPAGLKGGRERAIVRLHSSHMRDARRRANRDLSPEVPLRATPARDPDLAAGTGRWTSRWQWAPPKDFGPTFSSLALSRMVS